MAKVKNAWHTSMYDQSRMKVTIDSERFNEKAVKEASFIINHLGLSKGVNLLDVACGTGRHSLIFAQAGIKVTGIDINAGLISTAKKHTKKATFEVADMANLKKYKAKFDVTALLFSSFGYFEDDAANIRVMKELYSTLKPNGVLVFDIMDRDWLMKKYQPVSWKHQPDNLDITTRHFDPKTNYIEGLHAMVDQRTGVAQAYYHRIRLYTKAEMLSLLKEVGFKKITVFGDVEGSKFERYNSAHPFYFAQK